MSATVYARAPGVVWRLAPDRLLVRRVDVPDGDPRDLHGAAALVWILLDVPGTRSDIAARIADARSDARPDETDEIDETLRLLLEADLIVAAPMS